jgi:hypothetical protein
MPRARRPRVAAEVPGAEPLTPTDHADLLAEDAARTLTAWRAAGASPTTWSDTASRFFARHGDTAAARSALSRAWTASRRALLLEDHP